MASKKIDLGKRGFYKSNNKMNNLTGKEWVKSTKSWFIINPSRRKEDTVLHPAKFPEELVKEFVGFFTKEGEVVFDPFLGTGSTLVASKEINRRGFGIELNKKYAEISRKRLGGSKSKDHLVVVGDSTKILAGAANKIKGSLKRLNSAFIDFIITSPPYWDMLSKSRGNIISAKKKHERSGGDKTYSTSAKDVGNIESYEAYLDALMSVFSASRKFLKPNGYLVVVLQNIRVKKGHMVPLAWDFAIKLSKKYELKQERIWLQDNKRLNCWGYPSAYVSNVHHHYCLIFKKV